MKEYYDYYEEHSYETQYQIERIKQHREMFMQYSKLCGC